MISQKNILLIATSFITLFSQDFKKKYAYHDISYSAKEYALTYIEIKAFISKKKHSANLEEIGSIIFKRHKPYLLTLDVEKSFRNNGISLSLLYYMFHFYKKNNPHANYIEFISAPTARALYVKYGAEPKEKLFEEPYTQMKWNINIALEKIGWYLDNLHNFLNMNHHKI